jgi:HK97 family phage portal protein
VSLIRRAAGALRTRSITGQGDPWSIPSNGSLSTYSSAGVPVDEASVLSLLAVNACVRLISETVSGLPFDAVRTSGKVRTTVEPAPPIIDDPFGGGNVISGFGLTRKIGLAQIVVSLLLRGNAYCNIAGYGPDGLPNVLQVLSPDAVDVDVDRQTGERLYKVNREPFPSNRMLHILGMSLPGQPVGISLLQYAKRSIGLGIAAEEFGSMFFGNGAHLSGVIEIPGDLKPDQARVVKESFEARHAGMRHAHAVGVLTGGAKWAPISVSPEDAQFLATRAMQTSEIAMLFGVPPHMLGQVDRTTSWGKGIEEQTLGFLKYTLQAWVQRIEDAWTPLVPKGIKAYFNLDGLLRADTTTRYAAYQAARNAAVMTPNEVRALENLPPIEGGDDLFAPLNSAHTTDPGWTPGQPDPNDQDPTAPDDGPADQEGAKNG